MRSASFAVPAVLVLAVAGCVRDSTESFDPRVSRGALESSARLRHAKREIARILTIKNERTMTHG